MKSVLSILFVATIFAVVYYVNATPASSTKLQNQEAQIEALSGHSDQQAKAALFSLLRKGWKAVKKFFTGKNGGILGRVGVEGSEGDILPGRKLEKEAAELQMNEEKSLLDRFRERTVALQQVIGGAGGPPSAGGIQPQADEFSGEPQGSAIRGSAGSRQHAQGPRAGS